MRTHYFPVHSCSYASINSPSAVFDHLQQHSASEQKLNKATERCVYGKLGVHGMWQALRKAEPGDYKHAVNDM